MNYSTMSSQLQSALAKRAAKITCAEMWESGFRSLQRYKDLRQTKQDLKELRSRQVLDKRLLRMTQELSYMDALMAAEVWEG